MQVIVVMGVCLIVAKKIPTSVINTEEVNAKIAELERMSGYIG